MKTHILSFLLGAALVFGLTSVTESRAAGPNHVFELRVYHAAPGKLDALKARYGDHTDTIFKRHDMKSIGYWIPQENPDNLFVYVLEHPNRAEGEKNWDAFQKDPEWVKVRTESEAAGALVTKVDRTWMNPVEFSKLK